MRRVGVLLALLVVAAPAPAQAVPLARVPTDRQVAALGDYSSTMLGLRADARAERAVAARGGTVVAPDLHIWRLPSRAAQRLIPSLRRSGALRFAEPDRPVSRESHLPGTDPLATPQIGWHLYRTGADRAEPPGPGVPLTVVDSGLDPNHMEFKNRPNTIALNEQDVGLPGGEEYHGTIVASTAAAPADGVGAIGVYPQAVLRSFDLWFLSESLIVQGISRAAASGAGVINLSLGGDEPSRAMYEAIMNAFGRGTIVVAAAGNERLNENPPIFPADFPHVLTVGSTDVNDHPSAFSSSSAAVDLAAPGESIPWQHPTDPTVYQTVNGTSFSSPQVAAATAWVWTVRGGIEKTQLFDLMRNSARDLPPAGFDPRTGHGMLDIPRALTRPLPPVDPLEPNDDVDHIRANGIFRSAARPLTAPGRRRASLAARVHAAEDPDDVYRFWVPPRSTVTARIDPTADLTLTAWAVGTRSVYERGRARRHDLLMVSAKRGGRPETVRIENARRRGYYAYLDVFPARGVLSARYTLAVSSRASR
ncbi:MAG TPA: S8 family serine peptidase [Gaiellaceae bacterium]|nr:S8 family serine peptidase [Gaiellaceae bacterium]